MLRIGNLTLTPGMPHIAVGVSMPYTMADFVRFKQQGLNIVEIRVDLFADQRQDTIRAVIEACRQAALPVLLTVRSRLEGGHWSGTEPQRLAMIEQFIQSVDAVDLELSSLLGAEKTTVQMLSQKIKTANKRLIISHHDFEKTPLLEDMQQTVAQAIEQGADIVKLATAVDTQADIERLESLLTQHANVPMIVIGMGALGRVTRLEFPRKGSLLTFACLEDKPTAPGQIPLTDMQACL